MPVIKSQIDSSTLVAIEKLYTLENNFFYSAQWFENFINSVARTIGDEISFFYQNDKYPIVLAIMYGVNGSLRQIRSLSNYYSPLYSVVGNAVNDDSQYVADFFKTIAKQLPVWDVMELRPLAQEESQFLLKQLKMAGIPAVSFFCFGNWYLEVNGRSFTQYLAELKPKVRSTINTKTKQFEKLDGAKLVIVTTKQGLDAAIDAYETVYSSSWKNTEPYADFISGLVRTAEQTGSLRLGIAYLQDKPIAAQIWLVAHNVAYIFKVAYDEDYKHYAIGTVLTAKLMQYVIDNDKVNVVDYLQGDDPYKKNWMSHRRERWAILAFNTSTIKGNVEMVKEISKIYLKQLWAIIKESPLVLKNC